MSARRAAAAAVVAAACLGACKSQWYFQGSHTEIVTTYVTVRTEPPGAMVRFNGTEMAKSPVRIPVEYDHTVEQWVRQGNASPDWSPTQVVTHAREEMKRHLYEGHQHFVSASLDGHGMAEKQIELNGEAEFEVVLTLPKSPAR